MKEGEVLTGLSMAFGVGVGTSTGAVWVLHCGCAHCKTGVNGWKMGVWSRLVCRYGLL